MALARNHYEPFGFHPWKCSWLLGLLLSGHSQVGEFNWIGQSHKSLRDPAVHRCGACDDGRHPDCSGWCFCPCDNELRNE